MSVTARQASRYMVLAFLFGLVSVLIAMDANSALKRPAQNWNQCTPSGDQLNRLTAANPGAMESCSNMAKNAQAQGKSFSFFCSPAGHFACCDESNCTDVGKAAKRQMSGAVRPETSVGSVQVPPSPPGVRPGAAPAPGGALQPSGAR